MDVPADMRVRYVTGLKMTMYLFCQFIEMYETETSQPNAVAVKKVSMIWKCVCGGGGGEGCVCVKSIEVFPFFLFFF